MKGIRTGFPVIMTLAIVAMVLGSGGCAGKETRDEIVATANGDEIKAGELREFLGFRGGGTPASGVPLEKKKEALDRLIAGRLLAQEARALGLDNTAEYRTAMEQNERGIWIAALLRKEVAAKLKVRDEEIQAEAKKLREADKNLSEADAGWRAGQSANEAQLRKIEQDLVAAAKKEYPGTIDRDMVQRIGKGEKIPDDAVLAVVGASKVTYGETMRLLRSVVPGGHVPQEVARNPAAFEQVLEREMTGRSLEAYAKRQGLDGSDALKYVRREAERSVAINLVAEQVISGEGSVTKKEIADTYAEHAQMFVRDGKKIPLSQVEGQIRQYLLDGKRRKALESHIAELRKKAKITVNDGVLAKT